MPRRGLPQTLEMRHDAHYVDALAASSGAPVGRLIAIEHLDPNPDQPRQVMGDLSELMASIAEKGVIEPLIVRQQGERFQINAGERRYHAAVQVGLHEVPVILRDIEESEIMEIALIENIQRKDLTPFEESEALGQLAHECHYTHEDMARKLGKSRTSITESLALAAMPEEVRNLCRLADITSKLPCPCPTPLFITKTRRQVREEVSKAKLRKSSKPFVFNFKPKEKSFNLKVTFRKGRVETSEIIKALESAIKKLRSGR